MQYTFCCLGRFGACLGVPAVSCRDCIDAMLSNLSDIDLVIASGQARLQDLKKKIEWSTRPRMNVYVDMSVNRKENV